MIAGLFLRGARHGACRCPWRTASPSLHCLGQASGRSGFSRARRCRGMRPAFHRRRSGVCVDLACLARIRVTGVGDSPRCGSQSFHCLLVAYFVPRCPSICLASRSLRTHVFARAPAGPVSSCPPEARRGFGGSKAHGVSSFTAEGRSLPLVRSAVRVSSRRARRGRVAAGACTPHLAPFCCSRALCGLPFMGRGLASPPPRGGVSVGSPP